MSVLAAKSPDRRAEPSLPSFARVSGAAVVIASSVFFGMIFSNGGIPELAHKQADSLKAADRRKVVQTNSTPTCSTLVIDDMVFYVPKIPPPEPDNTRTFNNMPNQATVELTNGQKEQDGKDEIPVKEKRPNATLQAIIPRKEETNPQPKTASGEPPVPVFD